MIVVAVVAVLAAVAMPIYGKYVKKSRTTEAISNLGTIAMFEETYYSESDSYVTADPNPGTVPSSSDPGGRRAFSSGLDAGWTALGRVIPDGTPLYFQYEARAGQYGTGGAVISGFLVSPSAATAVGGASPGCTPSPATLSANALGIPTTASSNWYYVTAVGNQKPGGACSVFIKVIDRPDIAVYNDIQ